MSLRFRFFLPYRLLMQRCALSGLLSVLFNISYRSVLELLIQDRDIILIDIDSHHHRY